MISIARNADAGSISVRIARYISPKKKQRKMQYMHGTREPSPGNIGKELKVCDFAVINDENLCNFY